MVDFYKVKKEIGGVEYTAQFNGIGAASEALDNCNIEGMSNISYEKLAKYVFENVIVDPKLEINDFGKDEIGKETTKVINGVEYKAQFKGTLTAARVIDNCYNEETEQLSRTKLAKNLISEIITFPKDISIDDFRDWDELNEFIKFARGAMQNGKTWDDFTAVVTFGRKVMQGYFREEKIERGAKKASKE